MLINQEIWKCAFIVLGLTMNGLVHCLVGFLLIGKLVTYYCA